MCPDGCVECLSATVCTLCLPNYYLMREGLCYKWCPDRYVGNPSLFRCVPCIYDCLTCDLNGNCLSCSNAIDHRSLFNWTQRCIPLPRYFDNETTVAAPCQTICVMCLNTTVCSACIQGFYLSLQSTCESQCQPRYLADMKTLSCNKCPYDCYFCADNGDCLSCNLETDHRIMNN